MKILAISPHPDDDVIGAGGALQLATLTGDTVEPLYLTMGEKGIPDAPDDYAYSTRRAEAEWAGLKLGFEPPAYWSLEDGGLSSLNFLVVGMRLREHILAGGFDLVYCPWPGESHPDHAAAAALTFLACAPLLTPPEVLMYEVWTPLSRYDVLVDISSVVDQKRAAIEAHESQNSRQPLAEAILHLNAYRGLLHGPRKAYAEAFQRMKL